MGKQLLNLGCGFRYHDEWTNIDINSTGQNVIAYNLLKGIPFSDETFDLVYHSHIIEHFSKDDAPKFLLECYRVLKKNGIIRVSFPDLEQIISHYIRLLTELKNGNLQYEKDYDWIMLELYDQTVRNVSGGEMFNYFVCESIPNEKFVLDRCGVEAKKLICAGKEQFYRIHGVGDKTFLEIIKYFRSKISSSINNLKKNSKNYLALKIGKFRLGGEIHQWMYDSYSLSRLLKTIGFKQIVVRDAFTSYLDDWKKYNLDTEFDGTIYKPDSNYIEAIK